METYRYHIYVCDHKKPEGTPCCSARGSAKVIDTLRKEVAAKGLGNEVQITTSGSIGLCERGPNMVVYPEGVWYSGVTPEDVPEIVSEHFQHGRPVTRLVNHDAGALRSEIETMKAKMMAGLAARDKAGVLPDDLQQMIAGFRESRVLLTAIELDVFSVVGQGATAQQVAGKLHTDMRATEMLLNALVSLETLLKTDGVFHISSVAARYLAEGGQNDLRLSLMHSVNLWHRWSTLTDCVRKGTSVTHRPIADRDQDSTKAFIAAMHSNAAARAAVVTDAVETSGITRMLDVGGGSGAYSIAFARANQNLRSVIFDLPAVVPLAQKYVQEAGLSDRIATQTGDMHVDSLGTGYDLVFISAICHMNSPEENVALFVKAFKALKSGGRVVMQDFILNRDKTSPRQAALFSLNMLVGTVSGASYSEDEYIKWMQQVGFQKVQGIKLPGITDLVVGTKP